MIIWKYNEDINLIDKIVDNINHIKGYYAYKDGNNNIHVSHLRNKDIRFTLEYSFGSFSGIVDKKMEKVIKMTIENYKK